MQVSQTRIRTAASDAGCSPPPILNKPNPRGLQFLHRSTFLATPGFYDFVVFTEKKRVEKLCAIRIATQSSVV